MPRFAPLVALFAVLLGSVAHAQPRHTIKIPVEIRPYYNTYYTNGGAVFRCTAILEGFFPDVFGRGRFYDYVVTGPAYDPYGSTSFTPPPAGFIGFRSYPINAAGGNGPEGEPAVCIGIHARVLAQAAAAGPWVATASVPEGIYAFWKADDDRGLSVPFDGTDSFAVTRNGREPVSSYLWAFSDGGTSTVAKPTHRFAEPGTYTVSLRVTDADGNEDTHTAQVTVEGADLSYTVSSAPDSIRVGTDFQFLVDITNSGDVDLTDVEIRGAALISTLDVGMAVATGPSSPTGPFALAAGASTQVAYPMRGTEAGHVRLLAPQPTATHGGKAITGRPECDNGTCAEDIRVISREMTVEVAFSNADGPATSAPAGRQRRRGLLGNWITDHRLTRPGEGILCISGCVDVEVTVLDDDGEPVVGAEVRLGAPAVAGAGVVTPDQGGGFFCPVDNEAGSTTCSRQFTTEPTDAEGKAHAVYWFPGLTDPQSVAVTAVVTKQDFGQETANATLQMLPTRVAFGRPSVFLSPNSAVTLRLMEDVRRVTNIPNLLTSGCKKIVGGVFGTAPQVPFDTEFLNGIGFASDYVCSDLLARAEENGGTGGVLGEIATLFDAGTKMAGIAEGYWFHNVFGLPAVGLAALTPASPAPPFVEVQSDFEDAITAGIAAVYDANRLMEGNLVQQLDLEVFEVSYRQAGLVSDDVPALYFRLRAVGGGRTVEHTALVRRGYRPGLWLTESGVSLATVGAASPGDASLSVTPAGSPRPAGAQARGASEPFAPGTLVTLDAGLPTQEVVQVVSAAPGTVSLSAPLRMAHAAGATATRVDSLALGVPRAPVGAGPAAGLPGVALAPVLRWTSRSPALGFYVQVATDSLFATLVASPARLAADSVQVGPLAAGVRHYWRVRAVNLAGDGPWSSRYPFVPGGPVADAVATPLALGLGGTARSTWTLGATSESAEVVPSCGAGTNSVWFSLTADTDGRIEVNTLQSTFDTILSVWERGEHPLREVACNDDATDDRGYDVPQSRAEFAAVAGRTYRVRVASRTGAALTDGIAVARAREIDRPVNDYVADAVDLTTSPELYVWSGDLYAADHEDGEDFNFGCGNATNSLWWRYTPATDGMLLVSTDRGSGSEVVPGIGLWRADADYDFPFEQVACAFGEPGDDDDGDGEPDNGDYGIDVTLAAPVSAGETYFLRITGDSGTYSSGYAAAFRAQGPPSVPARVDVVGQPGWRMLSAPGAGYTVADLAALNLVQGVPGYYPDAAANLFTQFDGTTYAPPAGGAVPLLPGQGLFWYLYDRGIQPGGASASVGMPFALPVPTAPLEDYVEVPLHASGTGWNLVGNPYPVALDADDLGLWIYGGALASRVGQTWDPNAGGAGSYRIASLIPGGLAPWSGLFIENRTDAQAATVMRIFAPDPSAAATPQSRPAAHQTLAFELHGATPGGTPLLGAATALVLADDAADGWDVHDALALAPFAPTFVTLAFDGVRADSSVWKAQEARPVATAAFDVPLGVVAAGAGAAMRMTWPVDSFADGWRFVLTDTETGTAVDLRRQSEYAFTVPVDAGKTSGGDALPRATVPAVRALPRAAARGAAPRFVLHAEPPPAVAGEPDAPVRFALAPVAPNPSRGRATVTVETPAAARVRVVVYDVLGREVSVLADGEMAGGRHALALDAGRLASGLYVVRMTSGTFAATRRLTVVR